MPQAAGQARLNDEQTMIDTIIERPKTGRRISEIKDDLGTEMNKNVAVFRTQDGLEHALEVVRRLKEEAKDRLRRRQGHGLQPGRARRPRAGVHARLRGVHRGRRHRAQGVARGPVPRRLPERNDEEWQKHITLSRNGDDIPHVAYSPVTITQWQPEERKY